MTAEPLQLNLQKTNDEGDTRENSPGHQRPTLTVTPQRNTQPGLNLDSSPVTMMRESIAQGMPGGSAKTKEIWKEILDTRDLLHEQVDGLDGKLSKVLQKHEYEYMAAYNIQVKRKEQELLKAMEDLASEQNAEIKDIKIQKLESTVSKLRKENQECEKAQEKLREEIKSWKQKYKYEQSEHEFYQSSAMESKRKNKLLKVAVGRLQFEYDKLQQKYKMTDEELKFVKQLHNQIERVQKNGAEEDEDDAGTFMTRISEDGQGSQKGKTPVDDYNTSRAVVLPDLQIRQPATGKSKGHATDESFMSANKSVASSSRNSNKKRFFTQNHNRALSNATRNRNSMNMSSHYKQGSIPTENLKFSQFLDILFTSGMTKSDIKNETQGYVQVLETNYTDKIRDIKVEMDKMKRRLAQEKTKKVVHTMEKNDLEQLFVRCVEDMRKEIIRRRLKAEVGARKKVGGSTAFATLNQSNAQMRKSTSGVSDQSMDGNQEFEETLGKLADLAKGRVKFDEFTQMDRNNLLDLFVNNERTLLKIYEILFTNQNFKQAQILANAPDSISLNEGSQKNLNMFDSSMITQQTGHDLSIDQTTDHAAAALNMNSQSPYDIQNSSFALDDLNQDSQLVTERIGNHGSSIKHGGTQMSGKLMLNTLNQQSTNLPNILPAMNSGIQSDPRLIKNNPNQRAIGFSP